MEKSNWSMSDVLDTVEPLSHSLDHSQLYLHANEHLREICCNPVAFGLLTASSTLSNNVAAESQAYHLQQQQHYQQQNFSPISHNSTSSSSSSYEEMQSSNLLASSFEMDTFNTLVQPMSTPCCIIKQTQQTTNCVYQLQELYPDCVQPTSTLSFPTSIPIPSIASEFSLSTSSQRSGIHETNFGQVFDYLLPSQGNGYTQIAPISSSYGRHEQQQQHSEMLMQPIHDIIHEYMPNSQLQSLYDFQHMCKTENNNNGVQATREDDLMTTSASVALYVDSSPQKKKLIQNVMASKTIDSSSVNSAFCFTKCQKKDTTVEDDADAQDEVDAFLCTSNCSDSSFDLNANRSQSSNAIDSLLSPNGPFFWQYNAQSKGPKSSRVIAQKNVALKEEQEQEDKAVAATAVCTSDGTLADDLSNACSDDDVMDLISIKDILAFDPLSDTALGSNSLNHKTSCKLRKGDGNDVSANPDRLFKIGLDLHSLHRKMQKIQSSADYVGGLASEKARRDKNKLASKACRLKKKAQHEANKIKLHGLAREHATLRMILSSICHDLEAAASLVHSNGSTKKPLLSNRLAYLRATHLASSARDETVEKISCEGCVAGYTDEFVLAVLCRVRHGDPNGGLSTQKLLTPKSLIISLDAIT